MGKLYDNMAEIFYSAQITAAVREKCVHSMKKLYDEVSFCIKYLCYYEYFSKGPIISKKQKE